MEEIIYNGELLWPNRLGHLLVIISFLAAACSSISLFRSYLSKSNQASWGRIGRWSFATHGVATLSLIAMIFWLMLNRRYEYSYAYDHVSDDLAVRYMFSAFWEGQEGSFLLWMFWHIILGFVFLFGKSEWKIPVIAVIVTVQAWLASMLLGVYIPIGEEGLKIGSSPVTLLRQVFDAPIFNNADYITFLEGTGLNPTLQNYWMTIHPPTLFLGFASTIIPFAFVIAALLKGKHKEWMKPALPWALFSAFILGLGILMGGAWAYEALSFGGYWAWDPVENTSFVPWIVLVGGIHTHLVARSTGYSIKSTYLFYILSFLLVLYSTFLTRSGILGDTSAHAFTEMGLEWQLVLFISFFIFGAFSLLIFRSKSVVVPKNEEKFTSREFWMFIGSITLFFSALLISFATSLPVFSKIIRKVYDPNYIGLVINEPITHHNKYQIWIAVLIALLSGMALFLRYGAFNWDKIKKKVGLHLLFATIVSIIGAFFIYQNVNVKSIAIIAFIFAGVFAITTNLDYLITQVKGNLKASAAAISHFGFGILIFGVLFTGANEHHITSSPIGQSSFLEKDALNENIVLIKGKKYFSQGYWIQYEGDTLIGHTRHFDVSFEQKDEDQNVKERFVVKPSAIYANDFNKIASWNPDTEHYWHKDIFVNISGYPEHLRDAEAARRIEDSLVWNDRLLGIKDTFHTNYSVAQISDVHFKQPTDKQDSVEMDLNLTVDIKLMSEKLEDTFYMSPSLGLKENLIYQYPAHVDALGLRLQLEESFFSSVFTEEKDLEYLSYTIGTEETINWNGYQINLSGFDRNPVHQNYKPETGDIAISANITLLKDEQLLKSNPVYIVRGRQQFNVKDYLAEQGIHVRFVSIDPAKNVFTFMLAQDVRDFSEIPFKYAEDVPRSDIIVLEAKVFPGINMVWAGCLLMLFGLLIGAIVKRTA